MKKIDVLHFILIMITVIVGIGWAVNVYNHWQPAIQENKRVALKANEENISRFDSIIDLSSKIAGEMDPARITELRDSIINVAKYRTAILTLLEMQSLDSTRAAQDSIRQAIRDSIANIPDPPPFSIIDSVEIRNINSTWMSVFVYSQVNCQAVAEYGTQPGVYTGAGVKENSFNYNNHQLRIGNAEPLDPGTTYFIRVVATDSTGTDYFSQELTATTLEAQN